jgi:hypothetical protein
MAAIQISDMLESLILFLHGNIIKNTNSVEANFYKLCISDMVLV